MYHAPQIAGSPLPSEERSMSGLRAHGYEVYGRGLGAPLLDSAAENQCGVEARSRLMETPQ